MDVSKCQLDKSYFNEVSERLNFNKEFSEFYLRLRDYVVDDKFYDKAERIKTCSTLWDLNYYRFQGIKEVKRVSLCHDKFCPNCQNLLSLQRYQKYRPVLDELSKDYSIYHIVFTVPNVASERLSFTVTQIFRSFAHLIRFFTLNFKIKNIDFSQFGYIGAVRSLEITQNPDDLLYHPHLHCLFLLKKGLKFKAKHKNKYSFDRKGVCTRKYSDFEILLQKMWYMINEKIKITKESLEKLPFGYDVYAEPVTERGFKEVFKYAVKFSANGEFMLDFETFKTYYFALFRRKTIQGYGILNKFKFENDIDLENSVDYLYDEIIAKLRSIEEPEKEYMFLSRILYELETTDDIKYISKKILKAMIVENPLEITPDIISQSQEYAKIKEKELKRSETERQKLKNKKIIECRIKFRKSWKIRTSKMYVRKYYQEKRLKLN